MDLPVLADKKRLTSEELREVMDDRDGWRKRIWKFRDANAISCWWYIYCFEWIHETMSYKTASIQPLTSHLNNHPYKTSKIYRLRLEEQGPTLKWRSSTLDVIWRICQKQRMIGTYGERVTEIRAVNAT